MFLWHSAIGYRRLQISTSFSILTPAVRAEVVILQLYLHRLWMLYKVAI